MCMSIWYLHVWDKSPICQFDYLFEGTWRRNMPVKREGKGKWMVLVTYKEILGTVEEGQTYTYVPRAFAHGGEESW